MLDSGSCGKIETLPPSPATTIWAQTSLQTMPLPREEQVPVVLVPHEYWSLVHIRSMLVSNTMRSEIWISISKGNYSSSSQFHIGLCFAFQCCLFGHSAQRAEMQVETDPKTERRNLLQRLVFCTGTGFGLLMGFLWLACLPRFLRKKKQRITCPHLHLILGFQDSSQKKPSKKQCMCTKKSTTYCIWNTMLREVVPVAFWRPSMPTTVSLHPMHLPATL